MEKSCKFCEIVSSIRKSQPVFEDEVSFAFLDDRPLFPGHCLLVPKVHYATLTDLPDTLVGPIFSNAKLLARAVEEAMGAAGTFVAINNRISQSVPHLHIHVVPRRKRDGLKGFFWPRHPYDDDAHLREVQVLIRSTVEKLLSEKGV